MNACSERKPRSFSAKRTRSRNSLPGESRFRSVLCFTTGSLRFRRWHICGTKRSKPATGHQPDLKDFSFRIARSVATFLYVPIPPTSPITSRQIPLLVSRSAPNSPRMHPAAPFNPQLFYFAPICTLLAPHSEFNLPAPLYQYRRTTSTHAALLFPVLQFSSLVVANCFRLSLVFVAFCGLLLLLVVSCGLLRLFVASSRTVAIFRESP
jgi:hypothetical protein